MNAVLTTFLEFCNPSCKSLSFSPSDDDWNGISQLCRRHGLTPYFFYHVKSLGISLPEDINKKWLGSFLYQIAEERKARQQIRELQEVLDSEGLPFILLKGTSAMLRLYRDQGLRTFCDIDILIPPEKAPLCKQKMAEAGYKPSVILNSPEEEEVWKFEWPPPCCPKRGRWFTYRDPPGDPRTTKRKRGRAQGDLGGEGRGGDGRGEGLSPEQGALCYSHAPSL